MFHAITEHYVNKSKISLLSNTAKVIQKALTRAGFELASLVTKPGVVPGGDRGGYNLPVREHKPSLLGENEEFVREFSRMTTHYILYKL